MRREQGDMVDVTVTNSDGSTFSISVNRKKLAERTSSFSRISRERGRRPGGRTRSDLVALLSVYKEQVTGDPV